MPDLNILEIEKVTYDSTVHSSNSCAVGGSCSKCGGGHCGSCGGGKCANVPLKK